MAKDKKPGDAPKHSSVPPDIKEAIDEAFGPEEPGAPSVEQPDIKMPTPWGRNNGGRGYGNRKPG